MMSVNNSKNVSNVLVDKNYAALQVKRSNLTFIVQFFRKDT